MKQEITHNEPNNNVAVLSTLPSFTFFTSFETLYMVIDQNKTTTKCLKVLTRKLYALDCSIFVIVPSEVEIRTEK